MINFSFFYHFHFFFSKSKNFNKTDQSLLDNWEFCFAIKGNKMAIISRWPPARPYSKQKCMISKRMYTRAEDFVYLFLPCQCFFFLFLSFSLFSFLFLCHKNHTVFNQIQLCVLLNKIKTSSLYKKKATHKILHHKRRKALKV